MTVGSVTTEGGVATEGGVTTKGTASVKASRTLRRDAARNRELLLSAGRAVFARRGLEASLDEIARAAGVGVGTAYRHFGNKFDLAAAIMNQTLADLLVTLERAAAAVDPWAGLMEFLDELLVLQVGDRGLREVLMGVYNPASFDAAQDMLSAPLGRLLDRAKQSGAVRPEVEPSDLGCILLMLTEVADIGGDDAPHLWQRYLPTLLAGLRPGGPPLPAPAMDDVLFRRAASQGKARRRGGPS